MAMRPRSVVPLLLGLAVALTPLVAAAAPAAPPPSTDVSAAAELGLVPRPAEVRIRGDRTFTLPADARIVAPGEADRAADALAGILRGATGQPVPVADTGRGDIEIRIDSDADYLTTGPAGTEEAYHLDVSPRRVLITAPTGHGAFNAVQTLRQLMPAAVEAGVPVSTPITVPLVQISDAPRFSYRGVMIDIARSFQTVEEMKANIDLLTQFKISTLHLHLADDQGWRIEITNDGKAPDDPIDYDKLTERSGITAMNTANFRNEVGRTGYWTQADLAEVVAYAEARYIDVVPEIDVPSHTNATLHALAELNTDRSLPQPAPGEDTVAWNGTGSVGYSALDEQLPLTYTFIEHVFSQLAALTNADYVHMGGDESHAMGHERYVDFVTRAVPTIREATGKGTMGWNEYAEAGAGKPDDFWEGSVVQYWVGDTRPTQNFVDQGGKVVVSAASGAYLDQKYTPRTPIGLSWACSGLCDWQRYYAWNPAEVAGVDESAVLGVEGPMWSETIRGGEQAQFMLAPRAMAILETGWTERGLKDEEGFGRRLAAVGQRLTLQGHNWYESPSLDWGSTLAGLQVQARTGATAAWPVGLLAAPGSTTAPEGQLTCGGTTTPVTFRTETAKDPLHAAGVWTILAERSFDAAQECVLTVGDRDPVPVPVTVGADAPLPPDPGFTPSDPPTLRIGDGSGPLVAGEWVRFRLAGFDDDELVEITGFAGPAFTLRTDEVGEFTGHAPISAATVDGPVEVTATQGERTVSITVEVDSEVEPLPNLIDQSRLSVADVDSEETVGEDAPAGKTLDGDPSTFWHTEWYAAQPDFPHHITIDLGGEYEVTGMSYLRRQDQINSAIKGYRIYVSTDGETWGSPVAEGEFTAALTPQNVAWAAKRGRYVKLVALSSHAGNQFAGGAEINIGGIPA